MVADGVNGGALGAGNIKSGGFSIFSLLGGFEAGPTTMLLFAIILFASPLAPSRHWVLK